MVVLQMINGLRYKFTLSLISTACRNSHTNKGKKLGECKLTADAEVTVLLEDFNPLSP